MVNILRPKQLAEHLSVSLSTVWRLEKTDSFPKKIHLSSRTVGWLEEDVNSWIESRADIKSTNNDGGPL